MIHNCLLLICTVSLFFLIFVTCSQPRTQQETFSLLLDEAFGCFTIEHSQSILDQVLPGHSSINQEMRFISSYFSKLYAEMPYFLFELLVSALFM